MEFRQVTRIWGSPQRRAISKLALGVRFAGGDLTGETLTPACIRQSKGSFGLSLRPAHGDNYLRHAASVAVAELAKINELVVPIVYHKSP